MKTYAVLAFPTNTFLNTITIGDRRYGKIHTSKYVRSTFADFISCRVNSEA